MSAATQPARGPDTLWERYRDNFSRHLIGVSRYLQTRMMHTLQQECGHGDLRLGFAPYITLLGENGRRLSELAETLGISRQACNQAVKQVEAAGYIGRTPDPLDGRARQLVLTEHGRQLRRDGVRIVRELDARFAALAGREAVDDAARTLGALYAHLGLGLGARDEPTLLYGGMGGLLPRLSDYTLHRLMTLTAGRGHPGLKLSFGQVLTLVGPAGGRIQQIAAIQDVSKQAISAIATELEELGYLRREADPADARQVLLLFTARGEELIADSVASVGDLEAEFADIAGGGAFARTRTTLRTLYEQLCLEREVFDGEIEHSVSGDIDALALELQQRLGDEASKALGRLLLNPGPNEV